MFEVWILLIVISLLVVLFKSSNDTHNGSQSPTQIKYKTLDSKSKSYRESAGAYGEEKVRKRLSSLVGSKVNGYITSENLLYEGQNFEIDFLILVPNIGFILAEVKNYAGEVYCTDQKNWKQVYSSGEERLSINASKQVLRTRAILKKLLKAKGLDGWPIKPLVIFANDNAKILSSTKEDGKPQTPVIRSDMLDSWLEKQGKNTNIKFSCDDFNTIRSVIKSYESSYSGKTKSIQVLEYPNQILYSKDGTFPGGFKVVSEVGSVSSSEKGFKNARESLLNQARRIGANGVVITSEYKISRSRSTGLQFKMSLRGKIYPKMTGTYRWNEVSLSGLAVTVARYKN